ncbi:hypothetical protein ABEB36_007442 [Hypothenemus hampei]|uniref:EGF-like domain-containing protein n=1 Tax=Hypothenemus hampei TaxID=57062 RepID=A0ABD1EU45_HYPHA
MKIHLFSLMIVIRLFNDSNQSGDLQLVSKSHSPNLQQYSTFSDSVIMHFRIPEDTLFVSFQFIAWDRDLSIFGCNTRDVSFFLKYGAPPTINPDHSPFPSEFKNVSRPTIYHVDFQTDKRTSYINISSPEHGVYYGATFLAYEDPRNQRISQQGLTQSCQSHVDVTVYVRQVESVRIIADSQFIVLNGETNQTQYFKFLIPESIDHVILNIQNVQISSGQIDVKMQARKPPTDSIYLLKRSFNTSQQIVFPTESHNWYYLAFDYKTLDIVSLEFQLHYFSNQLELQPSIVQTYGNITLYNMSAVHKYFDTFSLVDVQPYKQLELVKESSTDSYLFSFKLSPEVDSNMFIPINITIDGFSVLKFQLEQGSDIGGTLQYILAFKPRVLRKGHFINLVKEPESHVVIGCIQKNSISVPIWPKYCSSESGLYVSPLILNSTEINSTVLIPYPESGIWYASFKLFCGTCVPCDCLESCRSQYEQCIINCELNNFKNCVQDCRDKVLSTDQCASCNCDGPCLRNISSSCNSSIVFDISSRPCYYGDCGRQGRCGLFISDGVAYSSCLCSNNYRGFDCSDGSLATPYYLVLIEFLLLIFSNIFFLPAAYIAYKREYYVETMSYCSIFVSSSFYHACDAGENILSFCIFRLSALQFADFYSALLAIWLTLLAIADLPQFQLSLLQISGAMIIAFCVTLNRYALWIFALPSAIGIFIIGISWYLKYRKFRCRFLDKKYAYVKVPIGITVVIVGLIIYGLLQTQANYKYLHSLWHIIMAAGVCLLLPDKNTFQVAVLLS